MVRYSLLILIVLLAYGFLHSLLASLKVKALIRGWFGSSTDRWYRLVYNIFATVTWIPVMVLTFRLPDRSLYVISPPFMYLMWVIEALAGLALIIGLLQTGVWTFLGFRQLIDPLEVDPPRLVGIGLYRWVRHPLYTAGLVFIWSFPIMTVNLLTLDIGLTIYILIGIRHEERRLLREFGKVYREYCRRTPMLVPRMRIRMKL